MNRFAFILLAFLALLAGPSCKKARPIPAFPDSWAEPMPKPCPGDWAMVADEEEQSFEEYASAEKNLLDEKRNVIYIQPVGIMAEVDAKRIAVAADFVSAFFGAAIRLREAGILQTDSYSLARKQYIAPDVMSRVWEVLPDDALVMLAIVAEDMYNGKENNDYIFGDLNRRRRVAVLSQVRFGWVEPGGEVEKVILSRISKTASQEIAHLLGMKHCRAHRCLMNGYLSIKEVDGLPMHLCPVCLRKLLYNTQAAVAGRYLRLAEWFDKNGFAGEAAFAKTRLAEISPANRP